MIHLVIHLQSCVPQDIISLYYIYLYCITQIQILPALRCVSLKPQSHFLKVTECIAQPLTPCSDIFVEQGNGKKGAGCTQYSPAAPKAQWLK